MPVPPSLLQLRYEEPVAVVGDIHGRADLLERLLGQLGSVPLLVVGDVGDRGPDTRRVIDLLVTRGACGVAGNHDEWLLQLAEGRGFDSLACTAQMGGMATLRSYGIEGRTPREVEAQAWKIPRSHRDWLAGLALVIDLQVLGQPYWLSHVGIPNHRALVGLPPGEILPRLATLSSGEVLWSGTAPEKMTRADRPVIMGHIPRREPLDDGGVIAIDTGAGTAPREHERLSAVVLPERRFLTTK